MAVVPGKSPRLSAADLRARLAPPAARLLPLLLLLQGCAHSWVDENNVRHVIGFAAVEIHPAFRNNATAGETIRVRSIGLSLTTADVGSAFVLGYQDTALTAIRNHSLVLFPQASRPDHLLPSPP